jgi:uncharacterized protein (TIGR03000 family)
MRAFPLGAACVLLLAGSAFAQRVSLPIAPVPPATPLRPFVPPMNLRFTPGPNPYPGLYPTAQDYLNSAYFYGGFPEAYVDRYPPAPFPAEPSPPPPPPDPSNDPSRAKITLKVPLTAEVYVEGNRLEQNGAVRQIVTPQLEPGRRYYYEVSVRWLSEGQVVEQRMELGFRAGDRPVVMVMRPVQKK